MYLTFFLEDDDKLEQIRKVRRGASGPGPRRLKLSRSVDLYPCAPKASRTNIHRREEASCCLSSSHHTEGFNRIQVRTPST